MGETDGRRAACTGQLYLVVNAVTMIRNPMACMAMSGITADRSAGSSTSKHRLDQVAEENKLVKAITV